MAYLEYNSVPLEMISGAQHLRENVFDGANNYLFTRHRIRAMTIYNPQVTSYSIPGETPVAVPGQLAPQTDAAIRHALSQPRRQLIVGVNIPPPGVPLQPQHTILRSPAAGFT